MFIVHLIEGNLLEVHPFLLKMDEFRPPAPHLLHFSYNVLLIRLASMFYELFHECGSDLVDESLKGICFGVGRKAEGVADLEVELQE